MTKNNSKEPVWREIVEEFEKRFEHSRPLSNRELSMLYFFKPYFQELEEKAWMYDNLSK